jgi:hypothetical protein
MGSLLFSMCWSFLAVALSGVAEALATGACGIAALLIGTEVSRVVSVAPFTLLQRVQLPDAGAHSRKIAVVRFVPRAAAGNLHALYQLKDLNYDKPSHVTKTQWLRVVLTIVVAVDNCKLYLPPVATLEVTSCSDARRASTAVSTLKSVFLLLTSVIFVLFEC